MDVDDTFGSIRSGGRSSLDSGVDPLTYVIRPSPTETPLERAARIQREQEAKAASDAIDEELHKQAAADRKGPKAVKILLLGAVPVPSVMLNAVFKTKHPILKGKASRENLQR